jgi:hypothetical protein
VLCRDRFIVGQLVGKEQTWTGIGIGNVEGRGRRKLRPCWRGDELRALREWAGAHLRNDGRDLSQFQLAEQINASERAVRAWEANDTILIQPALIENLDAFAEQVGFSTKR